MLKIIKVKVNNNLFGVLVTSQRKRNSAVIAIDYIWINKHYINGQIKEVESNYFQTMYDLFMQWHNNFVILPKKKSNTGKMIHYNGIRRKFTISINRKDIDQIENFRRIISLHSFEPDLSLTLADADFKKPWREEEDIDIIIYSRII
jgi:hypothetical protein